MGEASGEGLKGCPGAYSEAAAKKAYPSCETVPCEYFETAFQILNDSFLELPSNMVSVVSWFFKYAWWFFIEDFSSLEQIKIVIVNLQTAENGWYAPTALHAYDECTGMHTKLATFFFAFDV
ncbi:hypothetical protein ZWY2020_021237 [Hordeum vulgare]|nr:hypothetical protein ZWY2020_021237 [Hordeum vulgare]